MSKKKIKLYIKCALINLKFNVFKIFSDLFTLLAKKLIRGNDKLLYKMDKAVTDLKLLNTRIQSLEE